MRTWVAFGLAALATASAAQSPFTNRGGGDEGDAILPITSYPLGRSDVVAKQMARNVRMYWIEQEACDQLGCLIVRNDTRLYTVAEFRIELLGDDGSSRWSRNQLLNPLLPKQKLVRLKVAPADSCERDVQFVLRHRKTKERLIMEGTTNFCPSPNADSLIRIEVKQPQVTVQDEIQ